MAIFPSKKFRPSNDTSLPARYRALLAKHPFALFGLPFIATMVLGSFFLTPATALRYERHDRKVKQLSKEEGLGIGRDRRKVDMKEEYYVSFAWVSYEDGGEEGLVLVADGGNRNWRLRIWIIGSRSV